MSLSENSKFSSVNSIRWRKNRTPIGIFQPEDTFVTTGARRSRGELNGSSVFSSRKERQAWISGPTWHRTKTSSVQLRAPVTWRKNTWTSCELKKFRMQEGHLTRCIGCKVGLEDKICRRSTGLAPPVDSTLKVFPLSTELTSILYSGLYGLYQQNLSGGVSQAIQNFQDANINSNRQICQIKLLVHNTVICQFAKILWSEWKPPRLFP